jgi:hypothetical protein
VKRLTALVEALREKGITAPSAPTEFPIVAAKVEGPSVELATEMAKDLIKRDAVKAPAKKPAPAKPAAPAKKAAPAKPEVVAKPAKSAPVKAAPAPAKPAPKAALGCEAHHSADPH